MKLATQEKKMASQYSTLTRHDLEAKIVRHSWQDEAFRKEFIADPTGTFVRYLEIPAEGMPKVVVHQEQPDSWHIVLPARPANVDELSQEELERVAGGASALVFSITTVVGVSALINVSASVSLAYEFVSGPIGEATGW
jgi:hypothetical protein